MAASALNTSGGWTVHKSFNTGAGPYLSYKIAGSLRNRSIHTTAQVDHVKWLVQRNTASIALSEDYPAPPDLDGPAIDWSNMPAVIEKLLQMMLKPEDRRDMLTLNSNELVVVLNAHSAWPVFDMRRAVDELVRQLKGKWNYHPVRVLGGFDIQRSGGHRGVSLTVLNVCNMDLPDAPSGGMVACLDDQSVEEPRWERVMVRKSWAGNRDLTGEYVNPELLEWVNPRGGYYRLAHAALPNKDWESESGPETVPESKWKLALRSGEGEKPETAIDPTPARTITTPDPDAADADADMSETLEDLPDDKLPIAHPTWQHSTMTESLIDFVGRQAKRFATPDSGIGEDDPGAMEKAGGTGTGVKKIRIDDEEEEDYEMV